MSKISLVCGKGWHCKSERANNSAVSGSTGAHRELQLATVNSQEV